MFIGVHIFYFLEQIFFFGTQFMNKLNIMYDVKKAIKKRHKIFILRKVQHGLHQNEQ
jgi:hypothetical protein